MAAKKGEQESEKLIIEGIVFDCSGKAKKPLKEACIAVNKSNSYVTNAKGKFKFAIKRKAKYIVVSAKGFVERKLKFVEGKKYKICLVPIRKGVSSKTQYLPELIIVLTDKEFKKIEGNPNEIDGKIKKIMLDKARLLYEGRAVKIPDDSEIILCECNKQVGIIQNVEINGKLEGNPLPHAGSKEEGEVDLNLFIRQPDYGFGDLIQKCCCDNIEPQTIVKPKNAISVGVLDSGIDVQFINEYFRRNHPSVLLSNFTIRNKSCSNSNLSPNIGHGTMVVISLLERLYTGKKPFKKHVCINGYNIVRSQVLKGDNFPSNIITQADIVCALLKAIKENEYLNMSFGYTEDTHLIRMIMKNLPKEILGVTCSAGNEGKEIDLSRHFHYPSGYSREFPDDRIKEVTGLMKVGSKMRLWQQNQDVRTNTIPGQVVGVFPKSQDDAVINKATRSGGTSFSAPRYLASIIKGDE